MFEESEIEETNWIEGSEELEFSSPALLSSNSKNSLYRVERQGKYFIIKTGKDAFSQTLLQREYDLSLQLDHPYLVRIWTYEKNTPVGPGLVMEYINGRTLSDFLEEKPSLKERERIFGQLLEVLSYIHRNGVIHNDLKPENILITYSDQDVKLIDLGLSDNDSHAQDKTLGFSRPYASPELQSRSSDLDSRSDIFAIGMVMKKMFGHHYAWISNKCTQEQINKRYHNSDELFHSWKKRNFPLQALLSLFILITITTPTLLYIHEWEERKKITQSIEKKAHLTDSLVQIIGTRLDKRCEEALDSISCCNDEVTRFGYMLHYLEYSWKLMDELHDETDDIEISARIDAYCNQVRISHQDKIQTVLNRR